MKILVYEVEIKRCNHEKRLMNKIYSELIKVEWLFESRTFLGGLMNQFFIRTWVTENYIIQVIFMLNLRIHLICLRRKTIKSKLNLTLILKLTATTSLVLMIALHFCNFKKIKLFNSLRNNKYQNIKCINY